MSRGLTILLRRGIKDHTEMELSDNRRDWLMAPTVDGRKLSDGRVVSKTIQPPELRPSIRDEVMEFVVVVLALLIGRGWTWILGSGLRSVTATANAPAVQLTIYVIAALATGFAISELERRAGFPSRLSHRATIGFFAGFISYPWFLPGSALIYRRRQVQHAIAYLVASPLLTLSALLGGYISSRPEFTLP